MRLRSRVAGAFTTFNDWRFETRPIIHFWASFALTIDLILLLVGGVAVPWLTRSQVPELAQRALIVTLLLSALAVAWSRPWCLVEQMAMYEEERKIRARLMRSATAVLSRVVRRFKGGA